MPAITETAAIRLELEGQTLQSVESYRARFPKMPSRRKAVEQLLERALTSLSLAGQSAPSLGT